jgi:hypothetical protein
LRAGACGRSGEGLHGWYGWLLGEITKNREAAFA